jgi:NAD(P)H dehydrogenase (quinone)
MNHLIILAHPSPTSFSHRVADALVADGEQKGWSVVVRDLYKMGFDPVLSASDLEMMRGGEVPQDIANEQLMVDKADVVTVVYPMWWTGFPAILKGYIDRVLSWGFAYKSEAGEVVGQLTGKKVLIFSSLGNDVARYEENRLIDAFRKINSEEIFGFCGMEVVSQKFLGKITTATGEQTDNYINDILSEYAQFERIKCVSCC